MAYQLERSLHFAVVFLILVMKGCLVFTAPHRLHMRQPMSILNNLEMETSNVFQAYIAFHGDRNTSIPSEIPDVVISGATVQERLLHIYSKTMLFRAHVQQVQLYHKQKWSQSQPLATLLNNVHVRCGYFASSIRAQLQTAVPTLPALERGSHSNRYSIRVYGWAVLRRLQDWITAVETVLTADLPRTPERP